MFKVKTQRIHTSSSSSSGSGVVVEGRPIIILFFVDEAFVVLSVVDALNFIIIIVLKLRIK